MRRVSAILGLLGALLVSVPVGFAFPEAHSPNQQQWEDLFMTTFWAALVVGVLVEGLLLYTLVRFRRRPGGPQEGPHIHGNTKMEIAWTIAPALVMGWLLVISYNGLFEQDRGPSADFYVTVTGAQFSWTFQYPNGQTSIGELRVEQGRAVWLNVTSIDVIHAFNVPNLGVMIDAVPGTFNHAWFQADAPGTYHAMCRELCNNEYRAGHGDMVAKVVVFAPGEQALPYGKPPAASPSPSPSPSPTNTTSPTNGTTPTGNATGEVVEVQLAPGNDFVLDPKEVKLEKGKTVTIRAMNAASIAHNLYIGTFEQEKPDHGATWKSDPSLPGGASDEFTFTVPDEDVTLEMWCDIPGHRTGFGQGMSGTVVVGEGGEGPGAERPLLPGPGLAPFLLGLVAVLLLRGRRR